MTSNRQGLSQGLYGITQPVQAHQQTASTVLKELSNVLARLFSITFEVL